MSRKTPQEDKDALRKRWPWGNQSPSGRIASQRETLRKISEQRRIETARHEEKLRRLDQMKAATEDAIQEAERFQSEEMRNRNMRLAIELLETYGIDKLDYARSEKDLEERNKRLGASLAKARETQGVTPDAADNLSGLMDAIEADLITPSGQDESVS